MGHSDFASRPRGITPHLSFRCLNPLEKMQPFLAAPQRGWPRGISVNPSLTPQPPASFLLDLSVSASLGAVRRVQLPPSCSFPPLEGPHLLQHILSEIFLLVHLQDGLPDLLVRKLQPKAKPQPLRSLAWALQSDATPSPSEDGFLGFSLSP